MEQQSRLTSQSHSTATEAINSVPQAPPIDWNLTASEALATSAPRLTQTEPENSPWLGRAWTQEQPKPVQKPRNHKTPERGVYWRHQLWKQRKGIVTSCNQSLSNSHLLFAAAAQLVTVNNTSSQRFYIESIWDPQAIYHFRTTLVWEYEDIHPSGCKGM